MNMLETIINFIFIYSYYIIFMIIIIIIINIYFYFCLEGREEVLVPECNILLWKFSSIIALWYTPIA